MLIGMAARWYGSSNKCDKFLLFFTQHDTRTRIPLLFQFQVHIAANAIQCLPCKDILLFHSFLFVGISGCVVIRDDLAVYFSQVSREGINDGTPVDKLVLSW